MKQNIKLIFLLGGFFAFIDQLSKYFVEIKLIEKYSIINNFFTLEYSQNYGIAFGISIPQIFIILSIIIFLPIIIIFLLKELSLSKNITKIIIALIIGGGLGNLIDRLTRGFVVDFISIWKWPIFNLADIYISLALLLIIIFYGKIKTL